MKKEMMVTEVESPEKRRLKQYARLGIGIFSATLFFVTLFVLPVFYFYLSIVPTAIILLTAIASHILAGHQKRGTFTRSRAIASLIAAAVIAAIFVGAIFLPTLYLLAIPLAIVWFTNEIVFALLRRVAAADTASKVYGVKVESPFVRRLLASFSIPLSIVIAASVIGVGIAIALFPAVYSIAGFSALLTTSTFVLAGAVLSISQVLVIVGALLAGITALFTAIYLGFISKASEAFYTKWKNTGVGRFITPAVVIVGVLTILAGLLLAAGTALSGLALGLVVGGAALVVISVVAHLLHIFKPEVFKFSTIGRKVGKPIGSTSTQASMIGANAQRVLPDGQAPGQTALRTTAHPASKVRDVQAAGTAASASLQKRDSQSSADEQSPLVIPKPGELLFDGEGSLDAENGNVIVPSLAGVETTKRHSTGSSSDGEASLLALTAEAVGDGSRTPPSGEVSPLSTPRGVAVRGHAERVRAVGHTYSPSESGSSSPKSDLGL